MTEDKKEDGMGTLKKDRTLLLRDERKMEKLKAKLHTDDDCECTLPATSGCCCRLGGSLSLFCFLVNDSDSSGGVALLHCFLFN